MSNRRRGLTDGPTRADGIDCPEPFSSVARHMPYAGTMTQRLKNDGQGPKAGYVTYESLNQGSQSFQTHLHKSHGPIQESKIKPVSEFITPMDGFYRTGMPINALDACIDVLTVSVEFR